MYILLAVILSNSFYTMYSMGKVNLYNAALLVIFILHLLVFPFSCILGEVIVTYMGEEYSQNLNGQLYNTELGSARNHPILKILAQNGRFLSIKKEYSALQRDHIITILKQHVGRLTEASAGIEMHAALP